MEDSYSEVEHGISEDFGVTVVGMSYPGDADSNNIWAQPTNDGEDDDHMSAEMMSLVHMISSAETDLISLAKGFVPRVCLGLGIWTGTAVCNEHRKEKVCIT